MPRNVEIKARVSDLEGLERRAAAIADSGPSVLEQEDVFFETARGRLKLRVFPDDHGELIYYERPDDREPTTCDYTIAKTHDAPGLRELLSLALPVRGVVCKQRRLYLAGQTRIHLDRVRNLGDFMELEVVLRPDQTTAEGGKIAHALMHDLAIGQEQLIDRAYIDLIREES